MPMNAEQIRKKAQEYNSELTFFNIERWRQDFSLHRQQILVVRQSDDPSHMRRDRDRGRTFVQGNWRPRCVVHPDMGHFSYHVGEGYKFTPGSADQEPTGQQIEAFEQCKGPVLPELIRLANERDFYLAGPEPYVPQEEEPLPRHIIKRDAHPLVQCALDSLCGRVVADDVDPSHTFVGSDPPTRFVSSGYTHKKDYVVFLNNACVESK